MTNDQSKQIEVIFCRKSEPAQDVFFDDPYEAIELIADVLINNGQIDFIAVPTVKCFDYTRKEIYYT